MTVTVMSFSFKRDLPEDPTGNGGGLRVRLPSDA